MNNYNLFKDPVVDKEMEDLIAIEAFPKNVFTFNK